MSTADSLIEVLDRLESGDEQSAEEIFRRFSSRLVNLARLRLNARERRKVDEEDIVQSVFRSFFVRQSEGRFELADWGGLWGLLTRMTLRKCGRRVESLRAACRDCRRELAASDRSDSEIDPWEAVTREPSPEEVAGLAETVEFLMRGLTETEQRIVSLRLQGYQNNEIAETIGGISERKVYRVLAAVRARLERDRADQ